MKTPPDTTPTADEQPDFDRGLFISENRGLEFNSGANAGMAASLITTQAFAMFFLIPAALFFGLRNLLGASMLIAWLAAGISGVVLLIAGIILLTRVVRTNQSTVAMPHTKATTDTRYRIRAVIPPKRRSEGVRQWAEATLGTKPPEYPDRMSADKLDFVQGGFEPIIIRPWFGIKRTRNYWWCAAGLAILSAAVLLFMLQFLFGGWKSLFDNMGIFGYGATGFALFCGAVGAELCFPTYIRLAPGQLDIFRYHFLGSGKPDVRSYDLRTIGLCVDFGGYAVALEPARIPGEPIPEFVPGKKSTHFKLHPEGHVPDYFNLALSPDRTKHCQRIIQAARTDQPTPQLPDDQLVG